MNDAITMTVRGVYIPVEGCSSTRYVPWSFIKKEQLHRGVHRIKSLKDGLDHVMVTKSISGTRIGKIFETEREALKHIDMELIKAGMEPKYILKKK